jgi:hypothetical protein
LIQLATDPNAARAGWRPAAEDKSEAGLDARKGRNGHAWPFISRQPERPVVPQGTQRKPSQGS